MYLYYFVGIIHFIKTFLFLTKKARPVTSSFCLAFHTAKALPGKPYMRLLLILYELKFHPCFVFVFHLLHLPRRLSSPRNDISLWAVSCFRNDNQCFRTEPWSHSALGMHFSINRECYFYPIFRCFNSYTIAITQYCRHGIWSPKCFSQLKHEKYL